MGSSVHLLLVWSISCWPSPDLAMTTGVTAQRFPGSSARLWLVETRKLGLTTLGRLGGRVRQPSINLKFAGHCFC